MLTGEPLRKANIRSFNWCSPLKIPQQPEYSDQVLEPESRWGIHLMAVANDANELILLQIRRLPNLPSPVRSYRAEKLCNLQLSQENTTPNASPGSILQKTLQLKARILSLSTGPWTFAQNTEEEGVHSATSVLAAAYAKQLYFLKITATLRKVMDGLGSPQYQVAAEFVHHPLSRFSPKRAHCQVEGPLRWIHSVRLVLLYYPNASMPPKKPKSLT